MSTLLDTPPADAPPTPPGGGAPVPPAPDTPPAPTPPVVDWRAGLPEELRADKSIETFKDVAGLVQSYIATKKMVGARAEVRPLTKDSTPEQVAAARKIFNIPEKPDGYFQAGVKRPESASDGGWSEELESEFLAGMHAHHASPGAVNFAMQMHAKLESDRVAAETRVRQAVTQELRREWGPNYDANRGRANRAIQEFGGDAMVDLAQTTRLADGSLLGDHPVLVKTFAQIGNALVESGAMNPEGIASGMTPEEAQAAARAKQEEMKKLPEGHPRTVQLIDEVLALTRIAMATRR